MAHCASVSAQRAVDAEAQATVLAALDGHAQLAESAGGGTAVSAAEVKAALRKARPTAAGLDGLKVHLYRAARDLFVPLLTRLFTAIGEQDRMPPGYHTGVIVPLHKGGPDRTRASQYRPITLLNLDYRLLAAVLATRLSSCLPGVIDPVQTAFLRDRSIGENIWFLQLLPHALAGEGRSAVVAVCDFVKAFTARSCGALRSAWGGAVLAPPPPRVARRGWNAAGGRRSASSSASTASRRTAASSCPSLAPVSASAAARSAASASTCAASSPVRWASARACPSNAASSAAAAPAAASALVRAACSRASSGAADLHVVS